LLVTNGPSSVGLSLCLSSPGLTEVGPAGFGMKLSKSETSDFDAIH